MRGERSEDRPPRTRTAHIRHTGGMSDLVEARFRADAFPGGTPRRSVLRFHERDLAHALFATGRAPGDRWRHGETSVWEWLHRTSLIPAYIRKTSTGSLVKTDLARSLDRSEKVALSYALGQAMTGVFCQNVLGVRHLMHVDRYLRRWGGVLAPGRRRPDLFGLTSAGNWVVAEAKGRSNGMEASLPTDLARQKGMIRSISGTPPHITLGCVASFPTQRGLPGPMRVDAVDPRPSKEAVAFDVSNPLFLEAYYGPFMAAIRQGVPVQNAGPRWVISAFPGHGLRVGMRRDLYAYLGAGDALDPEDLDALLGVGEEKQDLPVGEQPDGTYMETEWSEMVARDDYDRGSEA